MRTATSAAILFSAACALLAPRVASAQYFGKNKVDYNRLRFEVLQTEHFDVYHYAAEKEAAQLAARLAERWYARFALVLDHQITTRQPLVLYGSQPEFAQTRVIPGLLSESIGGVTEFARRRIVMPFAPTLAESDRVLGHEIVHAFQFDILKHQRSAVSMPGWAVEGMAQYLALGTTSPETEMWLRDAVVNDLLPERASVAARRFSPYQFAHALWAHLAMRFGDTVVRQVLGVRRSKTFSARLAAVTGFTLDQLYTDWVAYVRAKYAGERGRGAMGDYLARGRVRLGPALSPDGRQLAFFSERDRLSLDLFVADLDTRRVRKLATTAGNAAIESLQPIRSAGSWSPSGDRFVFSAVRRGRAALVLVPVNGEGDEQVISFPGLGQVLSPSWSPDGRAIAFSGLKGGFTDLYVYDLEHATVRQLTRDPFADLQPSWSPDGTRLVFVTERFSSELPSLRFGAPQLALINVATGDVERVPEIADSKQLNPQWASHGHDVYMVADPDRISDVYRLNLDSGAVARITHSTSGVAGITSTSPAMTVARHAPVLAFTEYRAGQYELNVIQGPAAMEGSTYSARTGTVPEGDTTPSDATASSVVSTLLQNSTFGLPDADTLESLPYTPRLSLERVGQPYLSSGGGATGTFVVAGGALLFGDMLGERSLVTAVQVGSHLTDLAVGTQYVNREHRWNWGIVSGVEPSIRLLQHQRLSHENGEPTFEQQADYIEQSEVRVAGLLAYPLSRVRRLEFTAGVSHAWYRVDSRTNVRSLVTGQVLRNTRTLTSGGEPATMGDVSAALVGDTAVYGPTSPLLGSRYRFEIAPTSGDLSFTTLLLDYRRYLMPVRPFTLAMRVMHWARYGNDADDPRVAPTFLGSSYFVRGYDWGQLHCEYDVRGECTALDELLGRQLVVGNAELRFPVLGVFSRDIRYGPVPLEGFVFADSGVVWSRGSSTIVDDHRLVRSVGAGVRVNALGWPLEVGVVRALDAPARGWSWAFLFRPAF